jgi:hypothetical protein
MEKLNNFMKNLQVDTLRNIELSSLFDLKYLTDLNPSGNFIYEQWIYFIVLINLTLSLLVFFVFSKMFFSIKPIYKFVRKMSFIWFTNTIFLLFYNLVRVEGVSMLSMRLILVLIILAYILIIIYTIFYYFFRLPKKIRDYNTAKIRNKYMRRKH